MAFYNSLWFAKLLFLCWLKVLICQAQQLRAEYSSVKMFQGGSSHSLFYDGDDSIYVFGGEIETRMVSKYSLEQDTITIEGSLPINFYASTLQSDENGNVFLFASNQNGVFKYNLNENTTSNVATLPWSLSYSTPTLNHCHSSETSDKILILGGQSPNNRKVLSFNMTSYQVTDLQITLPVDLSYSTAICVEGRVFIFPTPNFVNGSVWELDLDSFEMSPLIDVVVPTFAYSTSAVTDGKDVYIIGGFRKNAQFPNNEGLILFDPAANTTTFLPVANWPDQEENYFDDSPKCVYVQKLNRIYCFGGFTMSVEYHYHDEIFYIDMSTQITQTPTFPTETTPLPTNGETTQFISTSTMNPDFFTCINRPDGFYPNPLDCSLFIGCHNEEMDHFSCAPPLLFNPLTSICDLPHNVVCETSCINKENGYYPHPHDCSLYIICDQEEATLVKCPPPLLFDPILVVCNYPENVSCNI